MANFIAGIISLALGVIVLANVFITTVKNTNTSTFTASEVSLWGMLSLAGIIGVVYGTLSVFGLV